MKYIIGIDEAGRGPLAGPVSVGVVRLPVDSDTGLVYPELVERVVGARDSKKMTPLSRERLYRCMYELRAAGTLDFAVGFSDAAMIDREGIVPAITAALARALESLQLDPAICDVRLDGGLKAPDHFQNQTTIIRGDQTELAISLASIAAKVERDRLMCEIADQFPDYGLEVHKGYGTAAHLKAIRERGLSPIHRASFCTRI